MWNHQSGSFRGLNICFIVCRLFVCVFAVRLYCVYKKAAARVTAEIMWSEDVNSVSTQILWSEVKWSEVEWSGGWRGRGGGVGRRGFYNLRRALVIHSHADVICAAFIHVEEGNRGRIESNRRPLTSLWICFVFLLLFCSLTPICCSSSPLQRLRADLL